MGQGDTGPRSRMEATGALASRHRAGSSCTCRAATACTLSGILRTATDRLLEVLPDQTSATRSIGIAREYAGRSAKVLRLPWKVPSGMDEEVTSSEDLLLLHAHPCFA